MHSEYFFTKRILKSILPGIDLVMVKIFFLWIENKFNAVNHLRNLLVSYNGQNISGS